MAIAAAEMGYVPAVVDLFLGVLGGVVSLAELYSGYAKSDYMYVNEMVTTYEMAARAKSSAPDVLDRVEELAKRFIGR